MDLLLHPSDQPVFRLAVSASGCQLELSLNGVPVFRDASGMGLSFEMPVNEWLFNGPNRVTALLTPRPGVKARAHVGLNYKRLRQPLKNAVEVGEMSWESGGHELYAPAGSSADWPAMGDAPGRAESGRPQPVSWECLPVTKGMAEGSVCLHAVLPLPLPWPTCAWQNGADLGGQGGLQASIQALTAKLWQAISTRKASTMMQVVAARARDIETAYHLREGEVEEALLFPKLLALPEWKVLELPKQGIALELAGEGRMARLIREDDGQSALRLINEQAGVEAVIDAWWTFTTGWVLIR